jgi:hypothetical protein
VRWRGAGWGRGEREPARVWCRAGRLPDRGRGGWGGARRLSGERAADVGQEGPHDGRVLHDGDDAQPAATAGTGEDIEVEHAAHQRGPGPRTRGAGAGAGVDLGRGRVG